MVRIFALMLALVAGNASAGYYAQVTANNGAYCTVGRTSVCMLTVGMALYNACSMSMTVDSFDTTALTASVHYSNDLTKTAEFLYGGCEATASGGTIPVFSGGVTDPAVVGGQVVSGGGTTSATGGLSPAEYQMFQDLIVQSQSPYDYAGGGLIFGAMLLSTLSLYLITRAGTEILRLVRRRL